MFLPPAVPFSTSTTRRTVSAGASARRRWSRRTSVSAGQRRHAIVSRSTDGTAPKVVVGAANRAAVTASSERTATPRRGKQVVPLRGSLTMIRPRCGRRNERIGAVPRGGEYGVSRASEREGESDLIREAKRRGERGPSSIETAAREERMERIRKERWKER